MSRYLIKSSRGGLADFEDKGLSGSFKFAANLDIRKLTDSISSGQDLMEEGLLASQSPSASVSPSSSVSYSPSLSQSRSPSPTPSPSSSVSASPSITPSSSVSLSPSITPSSSISPSPSTSTELNSVFRDLVKWFVKGSDGYLYAFGNTGYIYRRDTDGFWQVLYKDTNGEIKGAAEWYSYLGKTYLYWATDRVLNRKELPGQSNWNDVTIVGQDLTSSDSHMMRECGGSLIIANGNNLALVGYDDSYTNNALNLIPGNIATTIVERSGRTIVGTSRASDTDRGINGAIDAEVPMAQIGDNGEVYFANMSDTVAMRQFPGGGKVNPGGVANQIEQVSMFEWEQTALSWIDKQAIGNMALFAVYGATEGRNGIYSFGRKNKNHSFVMNLDHQIDADELGALIQYAGKTFVSYRDGTEFGVKSTDPDHKAVGIYESLDLAAPDDKPLLKITDWNYAELFCKPLPAGCTIEFWYKLDKSSDWIQAKTKDQEDEFDLVGERKAVFVIGENADIFDYRLVLNPSGNDTPEIFITKVNLD